MTFQEKAGVTCWSPAIHAVRTASMVRSTITPASFQEPRSSHQVKKMLLIEILPLSSVGSRLRTTISRNAVGCPVHCYCSFFNWGLVGCLFPFFHSLCRNIPSCVGRASCLSMSPCPACNCLGSIYAPFHFTRMCVGPATCT